MENDQVPILKIVDISKSFGDFVAVNKLSFEIVSGECYGLLGPNGAGKTTTIEMIEGSVRPTSGEMYFKGKAIDHHSFHEKLGIQFQSTVLQDFLTVREQLKLFASLYNTSLSIDEVIETCHLSEFLDKDARWISGGQKQRLLVALALINNPELLFLDEPTTGLDPQARRNFWDMINDIKSQGKSIILTTHYMEEASYLCDRVCIIDRGKLLVEGKPNRLIDDYKLGHQIRIPLSDYPNSMDKLGPNMSVLDDTIVIETTDVESEIRQLIRNDVALAKLTIHAQNLEDLFLHLTGHKLRD